MSDQPSSGPRPLIPGQVAAWLGVVCLVVAGVLLIGYTYTVVRKTPTTDVARRDEQKKLRATTEAKAQEILTVPSRNADGTWRIPLKDALAMIAQDPKVVGQIQAAAAPTPSAEVVVPVAFVVADPEQMKRGAGVYARTCIACHQPTGMGLPPVFPPISEVPIIQGNPEYPVKFILHGLIGPITVKGMVYNSMMPPVVGVSDQDIADVLTYVRQSFGNKANPVSSDQVKAIRTANATRTAFWTTAELGLK